MPDSINDKDRKERNPLLPIRHPQRDFFVCDIFDAAPKSDMASMEHPLFTLATKPDMSARRYEHNGNWLELNPGFLGLATVFDRDILIYCISQCMAALNQGRQIHRTMRFSAHDLLQATNRDTSDKGYNGFEAALERLRATHIKTNIKMGGTESLKGFGFIDSYEVVRGTREGRMQAVEITLSDWIFNAIDEKGKDLLTIAPQYFQLRKPLERRLYEIARKSCGTKSKWMYKLETLHKKSGSISTLKEFRRMVKAIVEMNEQKQHIPDYEFELDGDNFHIIARKEFLNIYADPEIVERFDQIILRRRTLEIAQTFAGGYSLQVLEREWRMWMVTKYKGALPKNPDGSFVGFVKKFVKNNGHASLLVMTD